MAVQCSECGSDNVQRVSMAFESGISTVESKTRGVGLAGGGIGVGAAKTKGVQQSALSQRLSPPRKKGLKWAIISIIFGFIILGAASGGGKLLGLLLMVIGGLMGYMAFRFNKSDYPALLNKWQSSFYCNVCGSMFQPNVVLAATTENPSISS